MMVYGRRFLLRPFFQYSSGNRMVVTDLPISVMMKNSLPSMS